jgi:hypothetical protein
MPSKRWKAQRLATRESWPGVVLCPRRYLSGFNQKIAPFRGTGDLNRCAYPFSL